MKLQQAIYIQQNISQGQMSGHCRQYELYEIVW